jgi:tetratricopeptide (TPR) repeat protein
VHPRHTTLLRAISAFALTAVVCGAFAARPDPRTPAQKSIDALLNAARYDTARTLTITSLREAETRGDSAGVGALAFRFGRVSVTLGHQATAQRELDRAIRLTEASRDTANLTQALLFRGFVHRDRKEFDEAMAMFERARELSRRAHIASSEGDATYNIAYRELRRGNLDAARPGYLRAMELWQSTGDSFLVASGGNALGNLYTVLGEVDSARYWYNQSLRISRTNGYPFYELWSRNNLGDLGRRLGNYEVALEHYRAALAIGRRIKFDRGMAWPSLNMALTLSYLGQRDLAFEYLDECLAVCRRAGFKDLEVASTITAGVLHLEAGRNGQAAAQFRRILDQEYVYEANSRSEAAYGLSLALAEMDSVRQAIDVLAPHVSPRASATHHLGQPYFELEYANLLRRAGRYRESLERMDAVQAGLGSGSSSQLCEVVRLLESSCLRQIGDREGAMRALSVALDSLEAARSHFAQADVREAYGLHRMGDVIEGCRVMLEYPPDAPRADRVRRYYDTLQRFKTRTLLERIRDPRGEPGPRVGGALARSLTLAQLQHDVLRPGELLLDVFVSRDEAHLFAVSVDSCRMVALPGARSRLADQVRLFADLLSSADHATRDSYPAERLAGMQQALGASVLASVGDLVAGAQQLVVAPDGFYSSIPFGTLMLDDATMLMERVEVLEVPSASVLEWARRRAAHRARAASLLAVDGGAERGLAGARHEVLSLERRYAGVHVVPLGAGVLDSLARHAESGCILHIAAHARVNDASPWQSGFVLTSEDPEELSAPTLRAWQIARAHLPYEMSVLAGCETAGGRATNGEGVLGLTSAFLSAGVPVVVSSRWRVDDRVTAVLMQHFYDRLAAGESVASALRAAQLAVRANRRTRHPFYWAGFAVAGDGSRVLPPVVPAGGVRWWVPAVAGAVVLGLAGWTVRRRRGASARA